MTIESYGFGKMTIGGQTYTHDVILFPERVWDGWWRGEGHSLSIADLDGAFEADPVVLIIGTGFFGLMQVPAETSAEIRRRGIEVHVLSTRRAWQLYNQLSRGDRRVVAAFHLAC